jgi:protein TonB
MSSVSFFALSLALHAAALAFPVSFSRQTPAQLMRVTILPVGPESSDSSKVVSGSPAPGAGPTSALRAPASVDSIATASSSLRPTRWQIPSGPATAPTSGKESNTEDRLEAQPSRDPELQVVAAEAAANFGASHVTLAAPSAIPAETYSGGKSAPASNDIYADGAGTAATGNGAGPSAGSGSSGGLGASGTSAGVGNGQGSSGNGTVLSQARYRDTPRPEYPESARRQGREGRVLLRVLVDDQGRSKQVEINSSSGSDALDRAAAAAIQRWRFHPARHGDQPVESWLRIPIEFRLAEAQSR